MYAYFACCHDMTKPSVSHSFCFSTRLCSTIQVFFFLFPCLQCITFQVTQNLLPSTLHLRMAITALGDTDVYRIETSLETYWGYLCPLGLPGHSPLALASFQPSDQVPGALCQGAMLRHGGKEHRF